MKNDDNNHWSVQQYSYSASIIPDKYRTCCRHRPLSPRSRPSSAPWESKRIGRGQERRPWSGRWRRARGRFCSTPRRACAFLHMWNVHTTWNSLKYSTCQSNLRESAQNEVQNSNSTISRSKSRVTVRYRVCWASWGTRGSRTQWLGGRKARSNRKLQADRAL